MTGVDEYMGELAAALNVRGRARRRVLDECRDHLIDSTHDHGPDEAIRRFGPAAATAAMLDIEIGARRATPAVMVTAAATAGVAASVLAVLHSAEGIATSVVGWGIAFFAFAQTAAVCIALALLRAVAMHRTPPGSVDVADLALLARRCLWALAFACLTLLAAAGAVPGQAPAWNVLAGPILAAVATLAVFRVHRLLHGHVRQGTRCIHAPSGDLRALLPGRARTTAGDTDSSALAAVTVPVAALAAFTWSRLDHGGVGDSVVCAAIETGLALLGYLLLGPSLGLRTPRFSARRAGARGRAG